MKKILSVFLILCLISIVPLSIFASDDENEENIYSELTGIEDSDIKAKSAVLMDAKTGTLLYAKNPNVARFPASVTKIMTLLLVAEALAEGKITLEQKVFVSANAASMGGSQVFLKEGEEFTVEELLKCTVIASANDAAVALAELIGGSESTFVRMMNDRARELGMQNTEFENTTGLDDDLTKHLTSAYDIAIMSRELIKHECITKYSNVWQDSIRDGEFVLTNTNRLVRYYPGCTGLKTGSTDKAGYCISATAERDGMHLIAVIMGSETRDERNAAARSLLDFGFANYSLYTELETLLEDIPVLKGNVGSTSAYSSEISFLISKAEIKKIEKKYNIPDTITAPIKNGDIIGSVVYFIDGKEIGKADIYIKEDIDKLSVLEIFLKMLEKILVGGNFC